MTPAALRDSVGNLPAELTSFVGRRREVAEAKALLGAARLVTLTGMGGVGKTRLARRLAADVGRAFPGGVWQIELADLQEPALLVPSIAAALGVREQGSVWAIDTLKEYLSDKHLLLLLDNCEHLIDACAVTMDALLRACPGVRILATSREPLGISGEHTYQVGPLTAPDLQHPNQVEGAANYESVTLFVDRAAAVLPGFALDETNRYAVARLCQRLDGVPLAIELAALRLRALSPDQIVEQLEDHFVLAGGSRSAAPRQQTLRALVDWSYQLCSAEERLLWCLLSVFAGGFELDAAEGICSGTRLAEQNVVELLIGLVEKCVLVREENAGVVRLRMPEMIRSYGWDVLRESMDDTLTRRRHRDWYAALAARGYEEYVGPSQLKWFTRLRQEHANLRAALEFSLGETNGGLRVVDIVVPLADYWHAFGYLSEGRHWLEQALRQVPASGLPRAQALRAATYLAALQGDQSAAAMLEESRAAAEGTANKAELAWISYVGGLVELLRGDLVAATDLYVEARDHFQTAGDAHGLIDTLATLALVAALSYDPDRAADRAREFLTFAEPRGERWAKSYVLWALGIAKWRLGAYQRASELEVESLTLRHPFDDRLGLGLCVEVLAWITTRQGRAEEAAELLGAAGHALAAIGSSLASFRFLLDDHQRCETELRATLGDATFEVAARRGSELDFNEISAVATCTKVPRPPANAGTKPAPSLLTKREREIAKLIAQGMSNREIAAALVIAQRTAEGHVEHILVKLGYSSRAQIAAWFAERRTAGDSS
jgi:predicted ATPase/DNA-binding CsgD family transcriptional regulator